MDRTRGPCPGRRPYVDVLVCQTVRTTQRLAASRQDVEEYQSLQNSVNELVGRINGRYGTVEHMPIHFLHRSISFDELCALYAVSDACLVTSTRDGMNLVRRARLSPAPSAG